MIQRDQNQRVLEEAKEHKEKVHLLVEDGAKLQHSKVKSKMREKGLMMTGVTLLEEIKTISHHLDLRDPMELQEAEVEVGVGGVAVAASVVVKIVILLESVQMLERVAKE